MAKTPTRVNVRVTEADIERAHKNDSYNCVVAQAVARTVTDATYIEVDTQSIRFSVEGERRVYMTPYAVQGYVIAFDAGEPIEPFSFQLRDPRRAKRKVRTPAGKAAHNAGQQARRKATPKAKTKTDDVAVAASKDATSDAPSVAAKAAYAQARAEHGNAPTEEPVSDGVTRKAPPRVFKKKRRAYGHRLLRINQD